MKRSPRVIDLDGLAETHLCKQADVRIDTTWVDDDILEAFKAGWKARGEADLDAIEDARILEADGNPTANIMALDE